jgi:hypothetical protein
MKICHNFQYNCEKSITYYDPILKQNITNIDKNTPQLYCLQSLIL